MLSFDLYGDPIAQTRARFFRKGDHVGTYNPQVKIKEGCKWQLKSQYRDEPLGMPLYLDLTFFMPIPKSTSKPKRREMLTGRISHMKKPDIDNLQKFVLDCLNEIVIRDDSQVVEIRARKVYSMKPGTLIRIRPINETGFGEEYESYRRQG